MPLLRDKAGVAWQTILTEVDQRMNEVADRFTLRHGIAVGIRMIAGALPFKRGIGQVADSALCSRIDFGPELRLATLRSGPRIWVKPNDYVGRRIYLTGTVDRWVEQYCADILCDGDTVLDIGANHGAVGLMAAKVVGSSGRVHCFEPQPALAEMIRKSADLNHFGNIVVHQLALAEMDGSVEFGLSSKGNSGTASLAAEGEKIIVLAAHAGRFLEKLDLPKVRLLKIDVEGFEETVFRAAEQWVAANRPEHIVFESHGDVALAHRPVVQLLKKVGYSIQRLHDADYVAVI